MRPKRGKGNRLSWRELSYEAVFLPLGQIGWDISRLGKSGYWNKLPSLALASHCGSRRTARTFLFVHELLFRSISGSNNSVLLIHRAVSQKPTAQWLLVNMIFIICFCCRCWTDTQQPPPALISLLVRYEANGGGRWIILSQPLFRFCRKGVLAFLFTPTPNPF